MLKRDYEIMWKIAKIKILGLSKLAKDQNCEIQELKRENEILKAGSKYTNMAEIIPSRTKQIDIKA